MTVCILGVMFESSPQTSSDAKGSMGNGALHCTVIQYHRQVGHCPSRKLKQHNDEMDICESSHIFQKQFDF